MCTENVLIEGFNVKQTILRAKFWFDRNEAVI